MTFSENGEPKALGGCAPSHAWRRRRVLGLLLLTLTAGVGAPGAGAATPAHVLPANLPFFFEANCGQASSPAQFVARSRSGTFLLSPAEVDVLQAAAQPGAGLRDRSAARRRGCQTKIRTLSFQFVGSNPEAAMTGLDPLLSGRINYILGNDPARWRTGVPTFNRVSVAQLYPGVDVVYYGNERKLEYDLTVAPGTDPGTMSWRVTGADRLELDAQGDLVLSVGAAQLRQHKPIIYQVIGGARREVAGGYRLKDPETVAFEVGRYDPRWPLIIDPVLSLRQLFRRQRQHYRLGCGAGWCGEYLCSGQYALRRAADNVRRFPAQLCRRLHGLWGRCLCRQVQQHLLEVDLPHLPRRQWL